jgi:hypothetical protein
MGLSRMLSPSQLDDEKRQIEALDYSSKHMLLDFGTFIINTMSQLYLNIKIH